MHIDVRVRKTRADGRRTRGGADIAVCRAQCTERQDTGACYAAFSVRMTDVTRGEGRRTRTTRTSLYIVHDMFKRYMLCSMACCNEKYTIWRGAAHVQGEGDDDRGRVEEDGRNNLYIYIYIYIYIYMRRASRNETELGESIERGVSVSCGVCVCARVCAVLDCAVRDQL